MNYRGFRNNHAEHDTDSKREADQEFGFHKFPLREFVGESRESV
jgi:hypothetical protein